MVNNNSNSSNTANTAEDLSKMTKEELKKKMDELYIAGKYSEIGEYSEEFAKREKTQPTNTPEKNTKEKMEELLNKKVLKKTDKEELKRLLEQHQREREQNKKNEIDEKDKELKTKVDKPQNQTLNDMYNKLMDYDKNPNEFEEIKVKAHNSILPFIPYFRSKNTEEKRKLKEQGITTFNTGELEILSRKRRIIRGRMNRTRKYFNTLGKEDKDFEKAIDYMLSMSRKRGGGRLGASIYRKLVKGVRKIGVDNTKDEFDKEMEKQKKIFLDSITSGEEQGEEKQVMEQIKQRIDFYINNYKLMQARKRLA